MHQKWGDNLSKVCPSIQWSLDQGSVLLRLQDRNLLLQLRTNQKICLECDPRAVNDNFRAFVRFAHKYRKIFSERQIIDLELSTTKMKIIQWIYFSQVTIGSGVSVIKILSETRFERIGGTATGGGTFWGLGRLLTKAKGFDEVCSHCLAPDLKCP